MKVVLVGYMGSGKSFIGDLLSKKTGIEFLDLDKLIENKENAPIEMIFKTKGELYFRKIEHQIFAELLQINKNLIIATGGGTPCYYNNHEFFEGNNVQSVYLKASIDTLYSRLVLETAKRPLLAHKSESEMKEFIAKHLFDRSFYYNHANCKVSIDGKSADAIVNEIISFLA
jgi:shikimate kinase